MEPITVQHISTKLASHVRNPMPLQGYRKACVMVTLVSKDDRLHLLLTKRSDAVEHHKGQISFPGGMADNDDSSETETACRELEEEIGIPRSSVSILGMMDDIHVPSGFIVTPIVGYINGTEALRINREEVAEVLYIPLEKFLEPSLIRTEERIVDGTPRRIYFFDVWNEPVWGATAHFIKQLTEIITRS